MVAPFIEAFRAFAATERDRDPELARPMTLLADGLDHVTVAEPTPQVGLPVVDRHFEAALAAGVGVPADLARIVAGQTSWAQPYPNYGGQPDMDALRANYAYSPVIGAAEDAISGNAVTPLYLSNEVFVGLVLQGPGVVYPPHVHKAAEVYWVVSGTADWQWGDDWSSHGPGAVFFHDTGVRHATVTGDEPQLLLFAWVTDPDSIPVIIRH
ncbi:MAG: dimethylsulfonioproprionate lyase family protein [Actinomycetota bacterium]|nr:dimethylsulfonioproprionate lyase family protein [Actinomycetota bacterium]